MPFTRSLEYTGYWQDRSVWGKELSVSRPATKVDIGKLAWSPLQQADDWDAGRDGSSGSRTISLLSSGLSTTIKKQKLRTSKDTSSAGTSNDGVTAGQILTIIACRCCNATGERCWCGDSFCCQAKREYGEEDLGVHSVCQGVNLMFQAPVKIESFSELPISNWSLLVVMLMIWSRVEGSCIHSMPIALLLA